MQFPPILPEYSLGNVRFPVNHPLVTVLSLGEACPFPIRRITQLVPYRISHQQDRYIEYSVKKYKLVAVLIVNNEVKFQVHETIT
jgi:hypothetical protein